MPLSRRDFLAASASALGVAAASPAAAAPRSALQPAAHAGRVRVAPPAGGPGYDPWLEIDAGALVHNVRAVARLSGGRPVLVVAKNNAYGLGVATVAPVLEPLAPVWGFAVVRPEEALALREAGVRKPVLLMALPADDALEELMARDVRLAPFDDGAGERLAGAARKLRRPAIVHLYVDTGMHRLGMPHRRALPWIEALAARPGLRIEGAFTELTEDADVDREQVARLRALGDAARAKGVSLGLLHAASSVAVMHQPEAHLDMVRPGLAVYGGYVSDEAMARGELKAAYRLRARVVRVEQLAAGEGVSYHRRFVAEKPTWIATLPVGHVDGYPSGAVKGCEVLIRGRLCRVIGTVSASHTVVDVGDERAVEVGDEATLVGPDHPGIHPNVVAKRAGWSEYNMFMHLNPLLPRRVIS
jgi:alanine racemase